MKKDPYHTEFVFLHDYLLFKNTNCSDNLIMSISYTSIQVNKAYNNYSSKIRLEGAEIARWLGKAKT